MEQRTPAHYLHTLLCLSNLDRGVDVGIVTYVVELLTMKHCFLLSLKGAT
jgi:hypothetical protein